MNPASRILIIRLSSLGDILHTLPAFASLRASFPRARIDWLVARKCRFLLTSVRGIDALHTLDTDRLLQWPPDAASWRQMGALIRTLRAQRYDMAIDFQGLLKTAALTALSGSLMRYGFSGPLVREWPAHWCYQATLQPPAGQGHVLELNQALAQRAGAHPVPFYPDFAVAEADEACILSLLQKEHLDDFAVINPGGGWPTKRWSPENYGRLARRIADEAHLPVVVTTGPGEEPLFRRMAQACGSARVHHFPVTFLQLIPLFKRSRLVVGGDTGPFHLACALRVPVVGIFGPTSPLRNGPWNPGDEVVTQRLACSPCHGRRCSRDTECMGMAIDEVWAAVLKRLQRTPEEVSGAHP